MGSLRFVLAVLVEVLTDAVGHSLCHNGCCPHVIKEGACIKEEYVGLPGWSMFMMSQSQETACMQRTVHGQIQVEASSCWKINQTASHLAKGDGKDCDPGMVKLNPTNHWDESRAIIPCGGNKRLQGHPTRGFSTKFQCPCPTLAPTGMPTVPPAVNVVAEVEKQRLDWENKNKKKPANYAWSRAKMPVSPSAAMQALVEKPDTHH